MGSLPCKNNQIAEVDTIGILDLYVTWDLYYAKN